MSARSSLVSPLGSLAVTAMLLPPFSATRPMPLARLPGHNAYNETPKGALPRSGRIYVFQSGKLWREVLCDGQGNMKDVDLAHWAIPDSSPSPARAKPLRSWKRNVLITFGF